MKIILLVVVICVLTLLLRVILLVNSDTFYKEGEELDKEITLLEDPSENFNKQIFYIENVRVEVALFPKYSYSDKLKVKGVIRKRTFSAKYTNKQISSLYIEYPKIEKIPQKNTILTSAAYIRKRVFAQFLNVLPYNEAVLLYGIIFGGSSSFSPEMKEAFRNTGILHVVAASGMNVTMIASFLLFLFTALFKRKLALIFTIIGIFYYALIAGFEPSILRATIMASIAFSAGLTGRVSYTFLALFLTAFLMLMVNPLIILNLSFLLSFSSTAGIILFKPVFENFIFFKNTKAISDDISTTISAQLGSMPFMLGTFSTYSIVSVLVNALVLWTIPFLMILGGIGVFCSIALPFISFIPLYISLPLLWYFERVVALFGGIPQITFNNFSISFAVSYYSFLLGLFYYMKKKHIHEN